MMLALVTEYNNGENGKPLFFEHNSPLISPHYLDLSCFSFNNDFCVEYIIAIHPEHKHHPVEHGYIEISTKNIKAIHIHKATKDTDGYILSDFIKTLFHNTSHSLS